MCFELLGHEWRAEGSNHDTFLKHQCEENGANRGIHEFRAVMLQLCTLWPSDFLLVNALEMAFSGATTKFIAMLRKD